VIAPLAAQGRPLTVRELSEIYFSGGDVGGWDEFDVPEFVSVAYGARSREAILAILAESSSGENYYLQLEALTTAQYARVGVPTHVVMQYATGAKGSRDGGVLRHRAMIALRMRADPTLKGFWLEVAKDPDPSFRQVAAAGLSCALGVKAIPHLASLRSDSKPAVVRVAEFYHQEHSTKGTGALACGGRVSRGMIATFPSELRPELRQRAETILRRIP